MHFHQTGINDGVLPKVVMLSVAMSSDCCQLVSQNSVLTLSIAMDRRQPILQNSTKAIVPRYAGT